MMRTKRKNNAVLVLQCFLFYIKKTFKITFQIYNTQQGIGVMIIGVYWMGISSASASVMEPLIYYHIQYLRASLVIQAVKNLAAMEETQVVSLGQEAPLMK